MRAFHDGSILAGYRLERPLGRGGMGEVWLARDARLDRPVALKVLVAALSYDQEFRLRFLEETRLAAALDHPHIVPVYEAGESDGELFLAMRYVEGADLDAIIATDGPLDPDRVVGLLRGIADALDAAHARGLIHRDVKPGNILVTRTPAGEHAYLTDFGLTKRLDAGTTLGDRIVGSVGYIAPEQIEGGRTDRRSDVYSLACVVYAALRGQSPFVRESDAATLYAHLQADPTPIDVHRPDLSALEPVIRRALAKAPEDRQDSAGALMRDVATALGVGAAAWTTTAGKADIELPYVGLRAFDEADARFYFGREEDVAALLGHLHRDRFLAVFGPSGSGKSSLVRAGLLPALRSGGIPGFLDGPILVVRPGARPLEAIAAQVVRLTPDASMGRTVDDLATDPRTLHLATTRVLADTPPERRIAWVVDQAEELFTLCHDDEMREAAIATLVHAATVPDGKTVVVLAMRADFYHRCAAYPELAAAVARSQYLVAPMAIDGLRRAIIEPARVVGLEFEPGLVDTILEDVAARPGSLPLLEHALFELWDRRRGATMTLAGYRESGGVDGAIAVRAESIYNGLGEADQAIARRILLRLTQLGEGTEDTRRRATYRELGAGTGYADPVDRVVEELVEARLVTLAASDDADEPVVDMSHEALLRAWPRIRAWLDEDRADLTVQRWVADAAAQWEDLDRDDDGLFRGGRLAQAEEFRTRRPELLNAAEIGYIDASAAKAKVDASATERRRRLTLAGSLVVAAFFLGLSAIAAALWLQSESARKQAVSSLEQATTANATADAALAESDRQKTEAQSQKRVAVARQLVAQSLVARNDTDLSMLLGIEAIDHGATNDGASSVLGGFRTRPQLVQTSHAHTVETDAVAVSPDGKLVVSIDNDGHSAFWDVTAGGAGHDPIADLPLDAVTPRFAPDGRSLAFVSDGWVGIVDMQSGRIRRPPSGPSGPPAAGVAWTSDGRSVRWVGQGQQSAFFRSEPVTVSTWTVASDTVTKRQFDWVRKGTASLSSGPLSPDATTVATWDGEARQIDVFDATTGKPIGTPLDGDFFGFSPNGQYLAAGTEAGSVRVVSLPDFAIVGSELLIGDRPDHIVVSDDGTWAGVASLDSTFGLWDVRSGARRGEPLSMPADPVEGISIASTAPVVSAAYWDGRVEVFDLRTEATLVDADLAPIPGDDQGDDPPTGIQIAPNADRILLPWPRQPQTTDPTTPTAAGGQIWDVANGTYQPTVRLSGLPLAWTFGVDGRYLVLERSPTRESDRRVDVVTASLPPDIQVPMFVASPDGTSVVVGDGTQAWRIRVQTGEQVQLPDGVAAAAFGPDGKTLILASPAGTTFGGTTRPPMLNLTDATSGTSMHQITIDLAPTALSVAPGGDVVAVVGESGSGKGAKGALELVDLATGQSLPIAAIPGRFTAVAFDPGASGRAAITVDETGSVQHWDLDPASWRERACAIAGRNLSHAEWTTYVGDEPYVLTCPGLPAPDAP